MRVVRFHRLAEEELQEAAEHYEAERPGLGREFLENLFQAKEFLCDYPEVAQRILGPIRGLVVPRFPYKIIYRVLQDESIRVLAIAHDRRRPNYWSDRR